MFQVALIGLGVSSNSGNTVIEGNVAEDVFDLTVPLTLTKTASPGESVDYDLQLTISSSNSPWSVKVRSDNIDGKMREFDGTNYAIPEKALANPMHVLYGGSTDITLSDENKDLISNEATIGSGMIYNVNLNQKTDVLDSILSSGHTYQIIIYLTGGIRY